MTNSIDPMEGGCRFYKKVFSKIDPHASPLKSIPPPSKDTSESLPKKIIPSMANGGLREKFKETFLPLFIEIFELRQMIDNCKTQETSPNSLFSGKTPKSPQEILKQLEELQKNIEESKRWHEGVILQIEKGIAEAKQTLSLLQSNGEETTNKAPPSKKFFSLRKIFSKSFFKKAKKV